MHTQAGKMLRRPIPTKSSDLSVVNRVPGMSRDAWSRVVLLLGSQPPGVLANLPLPAQPWLWTRLLLPAGGTQGPAQQRDAGSTTSVSLKRQPCSVLLPRLHGGTALPLPRAHARGVGELELPMDRTLCQLEACVGCLSKRQPLHSRSRPSRPVTLHATQPWNMGFRGS